MESAKRRAVTMRSAYAIVPQFLQGQTTTEVAPDRLPAWLEFWTFPSINVVYVLVGCVILASSAGVIGCFTFLRKRSLIGDALAHAALPGVCGAFMLSGTKDPLIILVGAAVSCWLGSLSIDLIVRYTRCKEDSALGMVLTVFFGVGILMLTHIQQTGNAAQSGLDKFLFGQAASLVGRDVGVIGIAGLVLCGTVALAYKEFKVVSFDPDFAAAIGLPRRAIEILMSTLIVIAVAIGLQAVGVVLMAALLVTPAAAARYWTDRLHIMLWLSAGFGAASGVLGAYVSYLSPRMPTGPWMVVAVTVLFAFALAFAPRRGVFPRLLRHLRFQRKTAIENVLRTLYLFGEKEQSWAGGHTAGEISIYRGMPPGLMQRTLERLQRRELIDESDLGQFRLTRTGIEEGKRLTRVHRLWELYLTRKVEIAPDHVHDDAEEIEHILTPDLEARLMEILDHPEIDPHRQRIPSIAGDKGATA